MPTINDKAGDKVQLVVTRADNVLEGYMCETNVLRRQIYGRMTNYNPAFNDIIDVGHALRDASRRDQDALVFERSC